MSDNKCSLDNMLKWVLATSGQEQNQFYPPHIYSAHYNTATAWLKSKIVEIYPTSQQFVDILEPFLVEKVILAKDGYVTLPDGWRNFLDAGVAVKKDFSGGCDDKPKAAQNQLYKDGVNKGKCLSRPLVIVDQSEWDILTVHPYKMPTYENPIGCFFGGGKIKVCPFDIGAVKVRFVKDEKIYNYGYIIQPDETYIYDPKTTVETEWNSSAFEYLYKGISTLYSIWSKEPVLRNWSVELKQIGLT